jgi:hypothetical protein
VGGTCAKGEDCEKGHGRVDMVQVLCTHVCNGKMKSIETIPVMVCVCVGEG